MSVLNPDTPRPAQSPILQGTSTAILAHLAVIATWIFGLGLAHLPVQIPANVNAGFEFLILTAVAFFVSFATARMRNTKFASGEPVSGSKQILVIPLVLALGSIPMLGCASSPKAQFVAANNMVSAVTARGERRAPGRRRARADGRRTRFVGRRRRCSDGRVDATARAPRRLKVLGQPLDRTGRGADTFSGRVYFFFPRPVSS